MLIVIFISSQENKTNKNIIMCTMNYNISNVLARHARYESELSEKSEQKCGPRVLNYSEPGFWKSNRKIRLMRI